MIPGRYVSAVSSKSWRTLASRPQLQATISWFDQVLVAVKAEREGLLTASAALVREAGAQSKGPGAAVFFSLFLFFLAAAGRRTAGERTAEGFLAGFSAGIGEAVAAGRAAAAGRRAAAAGEGFVLPQR